MAEKPIITMKSGGALLSDEVVKELVEKMGKMMSTMPLSRVGRPPRNENDPVGFGDVVLCMADSCTCGGLYMRVNKMWRRLDSDKNHILPTVQRYKVIDRLET